MVLDLALLTGQGRAEGQEEGRGEALGEGQPPPNPVSGPSHSLPPQHLAEGLNLVCGQHKCVEKDLH